MKHINYIFILFFLGGLLMTDTGFASICDQKDTLIFFTNGVKSVKKEAFKSKESIKKRLKVLLPPEEFELLDFKLAYNDTHTLPLDLLESTIQFLTGNVSRFWRILWELEPMPDLVADKLLLLSDAIDYSALLTTDSLKDHLKKYQAAVDEGKKIILVAHSQGNLFGNQAYNLLDYQEQQSFGMISVANVDSNVLGDTTETAPYTTLTNDKFVIGLIALQLGLPSSPMPANTTNLDEPENFWGHSFIESYMVEGSVSHEQVISDILVTLANLPMPYQLVEPGVITVSLTWDNAPDIDLHVYEPNGTHVSWYNMEGLSGSLDRDDRSYNGPEHYHVPTCETLEEGSYRIGLDYYKGDVPDTAFLQIEAGLISRTFEVYMDSEYYGSDTYPERVANIWVHKNENSSYEFQIYE